jgi:hypothetical protein
MKTLAVLVALAAAALAVPHGGHPNPNPNPNPNPAKCTPATYGCTTDPANGKPGWQVCDVDGTWRFAGDCPPNTHCYFNPINQSPYCIP